MTGWTDFHHVLGDVDLGQLDELVVHRRQPALDLLGRHAGRDVEVDAAVRSTAAGLDLIVDSAGDLVAGKQVRGGAARGVVVLEPLIGFFLGFGVLPPLEHVGM